MDLSLHISDDHLQAILDLPARRHLELPLLKDVLNRAGIRRGLQRHALMAATQRVDEDRSLVLALGEAPIPPDPGGLPDLQHQGSAEREVKSGQIVGTWMEPSAGRPGVGVDGEPIEVPAVGPNSRLGPGLLLHSDGRVEAQRDGLLRREEDGLLRVMVVGLEERELTSIPITVEQSRMKATINLEAGEYVSSTTLRSALAKAQVIFGIEQAKIDRAGCSEPKARTLVVARGVVPVLGRDATLEVLVDETLHVKVDDFDRVDFHELHKTCEVDAGTPLARVSPAVPGIPGTNIRGQTIKAKGGRDLPMAGYVGEGTRLNEQDENIIEAAVTGAFRRSKSGKLQVQAVMTVDGDVDLKSGNVDTKLPLIIKGDIKAGFSVKSHADILVMVVIEDARVSAQGNVTVRGGILPGRCRVKAHGTIKAKHISGREIKGHDIEVGTSIRFSRVLATGTVSAKDIVSGRVICAGNVTCDNLGTAEEPHTQVQVGINPFEEALFLTAQQEQGRHATDVVRLKERCKLFAHKMAIRGEDAVPAGEDALAADLRTALEEFSNSCKLLAECEAVIGRHDTELEESNLKAIQAKVIVRNTAFPGVEILIGDLGRLDLKQRLVGPRFGYRDGAVVYD